MRRPLCLIALGYTFILWIVLQLVPWRPQTFPDWEKKRVWAEGTVAAKEYKRSSNGEIRLLVSMENVVLHETVPQEGDGAEEEGTEVLPQMLLCRSGDGSGESARSLDDALPMGTRVIMSGTFRSFPEATNAGEFYSARYYDTLGYSAQLTGGELAGILSEVQGGINDQLQNADCSQEGGINDRPQDTSRGQEGGKLLWIFRVKSRWKENCHLLRRRLGDVLSDCLPGQSAELLKAMLLGEKGGIDPELKNLYQGAGIVHILAISGVDSGLRSVC